MTFTDAASLQLICAHPTDAPEVLHFQGHLPKHQGGVFQTFCTLPGHILHLLQTFQTFHSSIYLAHLADAPEVLHLPGHIPEHHGCLFQIFQSSRHSCSMYCIWHIDFKYFRHSMPHLFVHILLMLQKFRIFSGHLPKHQGCFFLDIQTLSGHVLHLAYLFQIFQTFSTSFICACSGSSAFF